ncbi:hypothetical protein AMJ48_01175 [Parcubacteria bacterium DG_74_1]|nr:MAG: hypothetical protein AMJ48_01175 [Parcubacteria bacterium DG_74_1]
MDTTDPGITFDEKGICNYCKMYEERAKNELKGPEELKKLIGEIKKSNGRCLIGVSGGTDSTMTVYLAKKYGLNPVAVSFDNGWDTEIAKRNVNNLIAKLDLEIIKYKVDPEEFKDLQIAFLKASIPNAEIPTDHGIVSFLYRLADKWNIKYIIHGGNIVTEAIMPESWGYDSKDLKYLRAIHKKFGRVELKTFPQVGLLHWIYYAFFKKIRFVPILNYIPYNKQEAKKILKGELGWQDYNIKHGESIYTRFFQCYILPTKFGIDKRRAHFSTLINSGQMSREEALEEMKKEPYPNKELLEQDRKYVLQKLGLSEKEFEEIMQAPVKNYKNYPNNSFFFKRDNFLVKLAKRKITHNY